MISRVILSIWHLSFSIRDCLRRLTSLVWVQLCLKLLHHWIYLRMVLYGQNWEMEVKLSFHLQLIDRYIWKSWSIGWWTPSLIPVHQSMKSSYIPTYLSTYKGISLHLTRILTRCQWNINQFTSGMMKIATPTLTKAPLIMFSTVRQNWKTSQESVDCSTHRKLKPSTHLVACRKRLSLSYLLSRPLTRKLRSLSHLWR